MTKKTLALVAFVALLAATLALPGCTPSPTPATDDSGAQEEAEVVEDPIADTGDKDAGSGDTDDKDAGTDDSDEGLARYTISRRDGEPSWEGVPVLDIDHQAWLEPVDIAAHAQLCYDDEALYVRMWAEEENVRAEYPKDDPLAKTYEDSCLELFVAPVDGDDRYLNFEFNPNCAVGAQIGTTKTDRVRIIPDNDPYQAVSTRTEDGWEIEFQLPFDFIRTFYPGFSPESGMQMRGNLYKCGNLTVQKHYIAWSPVGSETPNFHLPEYFGVLAFA